MNEINNNEQNNIPTDNKMSDILNHTNIPSEDNVPTLIMDLDSSFYKKMRFLGTFNKVVSIIGMILMAAMLALVIILCILSFVLPSNTKMYYNGIFLLIFAFILCIAYILPFMITLVTYKYGSSLKKAVLNADSIAFKDSVNYLYKQAKYLLIGIILFICIEGIFLVTGGIEVIRRIMVYQM